MKKVNENIKHKIVEKFTEKSDPIKDMGIGIFKKKKFDSSRKAAKYMYSVLPAILNRDDIPNDIIYPIDYRTPYGKRLAFNNEYFKEIVDFLQQYVILKDDYGIGRGDVLLELNKILLMAGYPKDVNEKFVEEPSDPIADMGIGGYTFETLRPGAVIKVKRSGIAVTQNQSGQFTSWHSGMKLFPENSLLIINVTPKRTINMTKFPAQPEYSDVYKDIIFKKFYGTDEGSIKNFKEAREILKSGRIPYSGVTGRMIVSKKQFNNRFEIIERGFASNESVNEKFEEESDPIRDMGIGALEQLTRFVNDKFRKSLETVSKGFLSDIIAELFDNNKKELIKFLVEYKNIDIQLKHSYDYSCVLGNLAYTNHFDAAKYLVSIGANLPGTIMDMRRQGLAITVKYLQRLQAEIENESIKESINEKFSEDSDPVEDMGIGMQNAIRDFMKNDIEEYYDDEDIDTEDIDVQLKYALIYEKEDFIDYLIQRGARIENVYNYLPYYIKNNNINLLKIVMERITLQQNVLDHFFKIATLWNSLEIIKYLVDKGADIHTENNKVINKVMASKHTEMKEYFKTLLDKEKEEKKKQRKLKIRKVLGLKESIAEKINEKFSEDSDPLEDMGIGIRKVIDEWLEENDTEGDVEGGYMTPAMFIVKNHNDAETIKGWVEFLLREGNEKINDWEEDYVEDMNGAGVKFIPNSKVLPHDDFSYEIKNGQCYLYTSDWSNFKNYFNLHGDIGEEFIEAVLEGDARRYFEYNYGNQQLNNLEDALSTVDEQKLFDYLKPICEEHAGMELEADNISDLFDIVKKDIPEIHDALLHAYSNNVADAEEQAAYNDIVGTIRGALHVTEEKYEDNKLILKVFEEALNKFFISWYLKDYGIEYRPPHYGWGGDFNLEYFIEDFENALE